MRIEPELVLDHRREPIMTAAEIDRLGRDDDPNGLAWNDHRTPRSAAAISAMRAAPATVAPGAKDSITIRAFTSSGQLRRPVGPCRTSKRSVTELTSANKRCSLRCKPFPHDPAIQITWIARSRAQR